MAKTKLKGFSLAILAVLMTVCLMLGITSFSTAKRADAAVTLGTIDFATANVTDNGIFTSYNGVYYTRTGGGVKINEGLGIELKASQIYVFEVAEDALFSFTIKGSKAKAVTFTFLKITDDGYGVVTNAGTTKLSNYTAITTGSTTAATIPTISLTAAPWTFTTAEYKIVAGKYALLTPSSGSVDASLSMASMTFKSAGPKFAADFTIPALRSDDVMGAANTDATAEAIQTYLTTTYATIYDDSEVPVARSVAWAVTGSLTEGFKATATTTDDTEGLLSIVKEFAVTVNAVKDFTADIPSISIASGAVADWASLAAYLEANNAKIGGYEVSWSETTDGTIVDFTTEGTLTGALTVTFNEATGVIFSPAFFVVDLIIEADTRTEIASFLPIFDVEVNQGEAYTLPTTLVAAAADTSEMDLTEGVNFYWDREADTSRYGAFIYTATAMADPANYTVANPAPIAELKLVVKKEVSEITTAAWTLGAYAHRWDTGEELTAITGSSETLLADPVVIADSEGITITVHNGSLETNHYHTVGMPKIRSAATSYIEITVPEGFIGTLSLKATCYYGRAATLGVYSVDSATGATTLVTSNTNFASATTGGNDADIAPPADYTAVFNEFTVNLSGSTIYRINNVTNNTFYFGEILVTGGGVVGYEAIGTRTFLEGDTFNSDAEEGYQLVGFANYDLNTFYAYGSAVSQYGTYTAISAIMDTESVRLVIDDVASYIVFKVTNTFFGLSSAEIKSLIAGGMTVQSIVDIGGTSGAPEAVTEYTVKGNVLTFFVAVELDNSEDASFVNESLSVKAIIGGVVSTDTTVAITTKLCIDETIVLLVEDTEAVGFNAFSTAEFSQAQIDYLGKRGFVITDNTLYLEDGYTVEQITAAIDCLLSLYPPA